MRVLLGITGSVATVLTAKLIMELINAGHEVKVVATNPALYFLEEDTLDLESFTINLTDQKVELYIDKFEWPAGGYHKHAPVRHIEFKDWADILLIAPLSANTLAKMANGLADNFLSCIVRAWPLNKPLVIAPAMNTDMYNNPITSQHLKALHVRYEKFTIVQPVEKMLACGYVGVGGMADIKDIVSKIPIIE
ncbi:MAG: flavoprotein [Patescibacteria group bacterium]